MDCFFSRISSCYPSVHVLLRAKPGVRAQGQAISEAPLEQLHIFVHGSLKQSRHTHPIKYYDYFLIII